MMTMTIPLRRSIDSILFLLVVKAVACCIGKGLVILLLASDYFLNNSSNAVAPITAPNGMAAKSTW